MKTLKRYGGCLILILINILWVVVNPEIGRASFAISFANLREILMVIPPIFILLGLLDLWFLPVHGPRQGYHYFYLKPPRWAGSIGWPGSVSIFPFRRRSLLAPFLHHPLFLLIHRTFMLCS
ncbi:MAG TPA: hypothetical protein VHR47_00485 [Bacillota bacterium]|nr:hypothetical protein [Bacillota bacterium]